MSEAWIWEEIGAGRLKSRKYGRARRILVADLLAFAASRDDSPVTHIAPERKRRRVTVVVPSTSSGVVPLPEYA
jgi:hypothetical protein